jgi:hypothetical protein
MSATTTTSFPASRPASAIRPSVSPAGSITRPLSVIECNAAGRTSRNVPAPADVASNTILVVDRNSSSPVVRSSSTW